MDASQLQRLTDLGFQLVPLPDISHHFALERDGFVALVTLKGGEIGESGAPGLLTEYGFAALVWRESEPWFVSKGFERRATGNEVQTIRQFGHDLNSVVRG
jgi:hypothetical protein